MIKSLVLINVGLCHSDGMEVGFYFGHYLFRKFIQLVSGLMKTVVLMVGRRLDLTQSSPQPEVDSISCITRWCHEVLIRLYTWLRLPRLRVARSTPHRTLGNQSPGRIEFACNAFRYIARQRHQSGGCCCFCLENEWEALSDSPRYTLDELLH